MRQNVPAQAIEVVHAVVIILAVVAQCVDGVAEGQGRLGDVLAIIVLQDFEC